MSTILQNLKFLGNHSLKDMNHFDELTFQQIYILWIVLHIFLKH